MNIDNIVPSVLHVTAKENIDVSGDLNAVQTKSLGQLLEENNEKKESEENNEENKNG